jgi:hypothetical protein
MLRAVLASFLAVIWTSEALAVDPFQSAPPPGADPFQRAPELAVRRPASPRHPPQQHPIEAPVPSPEVAARAPLLDTPPPASTAVTTSLSFGATTLAGQSWDGQNGTWNVRATLTGNILRGQIRCYRKHGPDKDYTWSQWGPTFETTIDQSGSYSATLSQINGWAVRRVWGVFPQIKVEAVLAGGRLECPDGHVTMRKVQ